MKTEVQKISSCRVKVTVEAGAEKIDPIIKGVRSAFTAQAKIPGFRPGKAPWSHVEKLYSKGIQEEINQRVTRALIDKAYEEVKNIATLVNVENFNVAQGQGASVVVTIDTVPEFEMPDTAKWQVKKMNFEVTDEEIEERMGGLRQMAASFEEATADDVATENDLIAISFTSDLDKEALSDTAKHYAADEEYWATMDMAFYRQANEGDAPEDYVLEFKRPVDKYWWCTGFIPGELREVTPADELRVEATITFRDEEMATCATQAMKGRGFRQVASMEAVTLDTFYQNGAEVTFKWQNITESQAVRTPYFAELLTAIIHFFRAIVDFFGKYSLNFLLSI